MNQILDELTRRINSTGVYDCLSENMPEFQEHLNDNPVKGEGGCGVPQVMFVTNMVWTLNAKLVYEIGMNFGTTSLRLLNALKVTDGRLHLFEIDRQKEPVFTKLVELYPDTVSISWGNSNDTLGTIGDDQPDMIFVDGSHRRDEAEIDIRKSLEILKPRGVIVVDDWADLPVKAAALEVIPEDKWFTFGRPYECIGYYQKN